MANRLWGVGMWRQLFLAIGVMALLVGVETLLIESATIYSAAGTDAQSFIDPSGRPSGSLRRWTPTEWFPWMALMFGTIVVLYVFTLPKRFARGE